MLVLLDPLWNVYNKCNIIKHADCLLLFWKGPYINTMHYKYIHLFTMLYPFFSLLSPFPISSPVATPLEELIPNPIATLPSQ